MSSSSVTAIVSTQLKQQEVAAIEASFSLHQEAIEKAFKEIAEYELKIKKQLLLLKTTNASNQKSQDEKKEAMQKNVVELQHEIEALNQSNITQATLIASKNQQNAKLINVMNMPENSHDNILNKGAAVWNTQIAIIRGEM